MKLYYKNDKELIRRHKAMIRWWQEKTKQTDYQLLWLTFAKGLLIGALIL